ncbi:unnamed protein product [Amoebophrya sp. A25]|nr:unnamed protein product [Amoebophrya sp. A25]CAD7948447.1 unnamed protein product [Amoebophrya sp. A25]|eukprot:GSA25T00026344001.1
MPASSRGSAPGVAPEGATSSAFVADGARVVDPSVCLDPNPSIKETTSNASLQVPVPSGPLVASSTEVGGDGAAAAATSSTATGPAAGGATSSTLKVGGEAAATSSKAPKAKAKSSNKRKAPNAAGKSKAAPGAKPATSIREMLSQSSQRDPNAGNSASSRLPKVRKIAPTTDQMYRDYHAKRDWEADRRMETDLQQHLKENVDKSKDNIFHMACQFLDVYSLLNMRCVCKDFCAAVRVDQRKLKTVLLRKIARFLDFGANLSMRDVDTKMASQCPDFFSNHFDIEGTPYIRGVTLYTSDETLRCSWVDRYLFADLESWNPDPAKDALTSLKRLWDFQTGRKLGGVATNILTKESVPNRSWTVNFVKAKRWQEFNSCTTVNWKTKFMALFYHHHTEEEPIRARLRDLILREVGHDKVTLGIMLDPMK